MKEKHDNNKVNLQRRALLGSALKLGAVTAGGMALAGCGGESSSSSRNSSSNESMTEAALPSENYRIDVHCHHIPDFYRASMESNGVTTAGGIPLPDWNPQIAVNFMNLFGIQSQVVSISEPGVTYLSTAQERLDMAMQINDYTTNTLINSIEHPGRFGGFAVLPIGDADNSVDISNASTEASRAMNVLGMDGIGIYSNYDGVYLGDPVFEPLMATLNDLGAMVFVHPATPQEVPSRLALPSFLYEFPFDTTRAAVNLLYNGVFKNYPNIRWMLGHAGGAIPFLSYRTSLLTYSPPLTSALGLEQLAPEEVAESYANLFYDTALSPSSAAMKCLQEVTKPDHILFASDFPFAGPIYNPSITTDPQPLLSETFTNTQRIQVERDNALAQLPNLALRIHQSG
ncbi:amidohydrolase family protein [Alcanivorax sp.]|uniref:amidohydrolase family protein n=1 Tax=Alcanivorax sp. TaxID=1872427 RepID=UPI0032D92B62